MGEEASTTSFVAPKINDNPDGWGPPAGAHQFKTVPYAPYYKGEKLGRISDWTGSANYRNNQRYRQQPQSSESAVNSAFYFTHENDDDFQLVDMSKTQKKYAGNRRFHQIRQQQQMRRRRNEERQQSQDKQQQRRVGKQKLQQRQRYAIYRRWGHQNENKPVRDASVNVRRDWKLLHDFEFTDLQKAGLLVTAPEDLKLCGTLQYFDDSFDRVGIRNEKPLEKRDQSFFNVSTSDDPVIQELAEGNNNIFITDSILAVLMCATRSVYSWDVVVRKVGNKLYFDKRDGSGLDYLTVNETASEPPSDEKDDKSINSAGSLSRESTYINHTFSQQVLSTSTPSLDLPNPNPFVQEGDEAPASIAYRYRRFKLGEYSLVVRAELDGVQMDKDAPAGKNSYLTIKALNEFDPKKGIDWRQKLDTQRGAVLATELKNNSNKLARWAVQAILAGTSLLKLGFVSRVNPKSPVPHVIVGCQSYKPREFARQVSVDVKNAWGVFKMVVDQCMAAPDGKYILLKDPNKSSLHLYAVPDNVFDNQHVEEDEDEDDSLIPKGSGQSSLANPLSGGLGISPILPLTSVPFVGKLGAEKDDKGKDKE